MWSLKYDTNEDNYETDSQTQRIGLWFPRGRGWEKKDWEFGIRRCKLLHIEWVTTRSYWVAQRIIFNIL